MGEKRPVPFAISISLINGFMMKNNSTKIFTNFLVSVKHHISESLAIFFIWFHPNLKNL